MKLYHENRILKSEIPYRNSSVTGVVKDYFKNGKLSSETLYIDGLQSDYHKVYDENGNSIN